MAAATRPGAGAWPSDRVGIEHVVVGGRQGGQVGRALLVAPLANAEPPSRTRPTIAMIATRARAKMTRSGRVRVRDWTSGRGAHRWCSCGGIHCWIEKRARRLQVDVAHHAQDRRHRLIGGDDHDPDLHPCHARVGGAGSVDVDACEGRVAEAGDQALLRRQDRGGLWRVPKSSGRARMDARDPGELTRRLGDAVVHVDPRPRSKTAIISIRKMGGRARTRPAPGRDSADVGASIGHRDRFDVTCWCRQVRGREFDGVGPSHL